MNILRYPHLLVAVISGLVILPVQAIAAPEPLQTRFVRDFSSFSGSEANAQSLYIGLKHGTRITLAAPSATTSGGSIATPVVQFDPPTRPMGNGNVFICVALAKQQLANYGITEPTPQQLQAALTSGTIQPSGSTKPVVLKGILVQRSDGMGWGSIAKKAGMNMRRAGRRNSVYSPVPVAARATGGAVSTGFNTHDHPEVRAGRPGHSSVGPQVQGKVQIRQ